MRSPGIAIAWEFGHRLRQGLIALAVYALGVGTFILVRLATGRPVSFSGSSEMSALVVVPVTTAFMFFLGVFSFGFAADLAARESIYPARMFTLPVTTRALAGWPMLYGAAAMMVLLLIGGRFLTWKTTRVLGHFTFQPWGTEAPLLWPALLAAVFLCWTQALTWMPYGLRGLRLIVTVFWLIALDATVMMAVEYEVPEHRLIAILAPQLPLAYLAACFAVARARRGHVPDWRRVTAWLPRITETFSRRRSHFPSPERAQAWFEWRHFGWSLPMWVGILLPFELALLGALPELVFQILFAMLLTPPFMAGFVAATISTSGSSSRDSYGVRPFMACRPLTGVALIAAKLKVAMWSTLAAWFLTVVIVPVGLAMTGTLGVVIERLREGVETFGMPRVSAALLMVLLGAMASTWKRLVNSLFIDLTGREWVIKGSVLLALSLLVVIWPIGRWIHDGENVLARLLNALPWILGALVCAKVSAAAWIATRLHDARLLSDRTLVAGAAIWLAAVLALYGVLEWFWSTPHVASYFLLLIAILEIPLTRIAAAPLALAWNRHR
jgi:hypothetical protein